MAYGVEQRLAQRLHQRAGRLVDRPVAHHDQVDRHAVSVLDLGHHLAHRDLQGLGPGRRAGVEPVPQLALLGPGQPGHLGGVARLALDQGEGLQHGVVQVRGDLGPLGLAYAQRPLALEVAPQPQPPRCEHQAHAEQHRERGDHDRHEVARPSAASDEEQDAHDGQDDTGGQPQEADPLRATGRRQPPCALADVQLPQRDSRADQQDEHRHPDLGVDVQPRAGEQPDQAGGDQDRAADQGLHALPAQPTGGAGRLRLGGSAGPAGSEVPAGPAAYGGSPRTRPGRLGAAGSAVCCGVSAHSRT